MVQPFLTRVTAILNKHQHDLCSSHYTRNDPSPTRHCLLGWMAQEAGISLPPSRYNTHVIGMKGTRRFASQLEQEYGISLSQLKQIQLANDEANDSQEMLQMVVKLSNQWNEQVEIAA